MSFSLASETKSFLRTVLLFFRGELGDSRGRVPRGFWDNVSGGSRSLEKVGTVLLLMSSLLTLQTEFFLDAT